MTDSSPDFSYPAQFDTGPLSWVIGEIREALGRSRAALEQAAGLGADARATSLQHAKTHLHQAHGALQMVDIEGVGLMTQAAEQALERMRDGSLECSPAHCAAVSDGYQAVIEYLDELIAGAAPQPARLFPYYRALQEMLGAERIHPSDLLFVDLSVTVALPAHQAPPAPDYPAFRARFEKSLLPFLKSADPQAQRLHAQALQEAIALVEDAQQEAPARTFWLAMRSFAELVASGQLASDLYVKQLFGLINLQIRRLSQGQGGLPEPMLRDALFFIAAAPEPNAGAQLLRRAYRLAGVVPADYDSRRYGRIDVQALKTAKDALAQTKTGWDRMSSEIDVNLEAGFNEALATLAGASEQLGAPALAQLLRELARAASDSIASGRSDQFSMEMATAMLFVEHGLDQVRQLPADFEEHAEVVGARLLALAAGETPPDAPQWQGDLSRQIQQGQTVAVLAGEMKTGLRQVEKVLDDYYADGARRPALAQIDPVLHQLQGALAILDQDQAMRAAQHVKAAVRALADGAEPADREAQALQDIAQNIGALGFFIDMLGQNFEAAKNRFTFNETEGMFREVPFEKAAAGDTPFDVEPAPAQPEPATAVAAPVEAAPPMDEGDAGIEAELLEIFISEAQEVLALVTSTLPAAIAEPSNQETLTMLRRSFHTLKGSGRMVGLTRFADGGAAIERVMNAWLAEARAATPDLLALLDYAAADLTGWVGELAAHGGSNRDSAALVAAAAAVQEGGAFAMPGERAAEAPPVQDPERDAGAEVIDMTMPDEPMGIAAPDFEYAAPAPEPEAEPEPEPVAAAGGANVIEFPGAAPRNAPADDNIRRFGDLEIPLPLYNIYLAETDELMRVLTQDFGEWRHEPLRAVTAAALQASHTLAGTSATVGFKALREVAYALEMALLTLTEPAPLLSDAQRDLLDAALDCARQMLRRFAQGELPAAQPELVAQLAQLREQLAFQGEAAPHAMADDEPKPADPEIEAVDLMFDTGFDDGFDEPMLEQAAPVAEPAGALEDDDAELGPQLVPELIADSEPAREPEITAVAAPEALAEAVRALDAAPMETVYSDDLDPDLLPVFLEEAADLLPAIGDALRKWQLNPADAAPAQNLLRTLHTVKGSARMAGAMRLGQHTHEIETQIENMVHAGTTTPAAFDELLANYDHALLLLEQLQQPAPAPAVGADTGAVAPAPGLPAPPQNAAPARAALVRVRADILDRLVNQAGEVSITRSKLENQVGTLKTSLSDFSDNLARLSRQLREVEMQAESQIASRMSISSEREFDPLEFDRFTRLQELTRMMAESVNDVASFHESLSRTVEAASADLAQQSRLTRDLQRDLMRVRMVPFSSLSERLFRVARQSAKELDKRVNLDIRGSAVEIDRSVLEQMAAPFEHLLRNAIVHGVESRARRAASGKAETGELLVQVSQQGNEVVLQFADDGAGLDLAKIRAKARANGLIAQGEEISDHEAADLIFEPGFSTADTLTELAGRGVGMDVVRSEAQALGGRVAIESEPGKGARFTINLPLTLAVTQVVLTSSAGKTYALPSILVEQVLQMKEAALAEAQAEGVLTFQGHKVALHYLPALLGERDARPPLQRSSPVMILKSGADRLAVQVDDVIGNREVVIKNIGPQLSRMVGISGATVLGSGEIVLILNPVALALHSVHHTGQQPAAAAVPAAGRDAVIMVVDDSLTVRRVTQRLLEREGYRVILAKDGVDALEHLQETIPDLMLVDIEMPRMDGFDLTRNIRGNDSTRDVPIIMITSRTADKHRNYALDLGVNAYFGKPFQEDMLLAAIAGLLNREMPA
jgi:chemosensory pili system protein ChpA (sensor histidine kinase/response regulator)